MALCRIALVYDADVCRGRRHEATQLGEHDHEADLPQDGGLAGHVGTGHQQHPLTLAEGHVVRHELLARHEPLDDGVA